METSEISFCDKNSLNINSDITKEEIINLLEKYNLSIKKKGLYFK